MNANPNPTNAIQKKVEVAVAILYRDREIFLQLRDDIPGIVLPGCWGMFGGHLEPGETPVEGLRRELKEEIDYDCDRADLFRSFSYNDGPISRVRHVFAVPLTVSEDRLTLNEGWDMGWWTPEQIRAGERYSARAESVRPLAEPHREAILAFLQST